jgi:uncharacterized LabA/DUF88 family protein
MKALSSANLYVDIQNEMSMIVTNDGDFAGLVELLKQSGKEIILFSRKERISQPILYQDGIKYLIESIKICSTCSELSLKF